MFLPDMLYIIGFKSVEYETNPSFMASIWDDCQRSSAK